MPSPWDVQEVAGRDGCKDAGYEGVSAAVSTIGRHSLPIKDSAHQSVERRVYRADSSELFLHQLPRQSLDSVMKCASYLPLHLCQTDWVFLVCYDWGNFSGIREISKLVSGVKGSKTEWMLLNKDASVRMKT